MIGARSWDKSFVCCFPNQNSDSGLKLGKLETSEPAIRYWTINQDGIALTKSTRFYLVERFHKVGVRCMDNLFFPCIPDRNLCLAVSWPLFFSRLSSLLSSPSLLPCHLPSWSFSSSLPLVVLPDSLPCLPLTLSRKNKHIALLSLLYRIGLSALEFIHPRTFGSFPYWHRLFSRFYRSRAGASPRFQRPPDFGPIERWCGFWGEREVSRLPSADP